MNKNGMNWIRQEKRLAIYLRDGVACAWCGQGVEDGIKLTLDHLVPRSQQGGHHESNLVTSCNSCNKLRGDRSPEEYAPVAAERHQRMTADEILEHVRLCTERSLPEFLVQSKRMISLRGSAARAVRHLA